MSDAVTSNVTECPTNDMDIAVLLPCYNEAATIFDVVKDFQKSLPSARIYVYDNNSSDETALLAGKAGAQVVREIRQGKGHVVRRMFSDIDADVYIMADGDGTYAAQDAPELVRLLVTENSDMVVGTRLGVTDDAGRKGHAFGNTIFNKLYREIFGNDFSDIFSGYRAFSRRYVKSFPAISGGFEIETEMSVHASTLQLPVTEIGLEYGRRPEGSDSKLSTFKDGAKILLKFASLMKETRPLLFFGYVSLAIFATSLFFMLPVLNEYFHTGLVDRMPTWVSSMALLMMSIMVFSAGIVLDSLAKSRLEQKRILYMAIEGLQSKQSNDRNVDLLREKTVQMRTNKRSKNRTNNAA
ncbi:glycosyltransferase [Lentilitoribacter sp. Alg239-R112]|jgi:glycosyltransferase involved in cell wall biosynthesis|uniref:glycosyltransferase n=1 Tax=Lentilitoribacter sp. Alg239-R112 TaxID=2305987 RepID=UPI0013A6C81C|nr:glycosyltransferase [Lentilitoribacter sp. Alg239-R112]